MAERRRSSLSLDGADDITTPRGGGHLDRRLIKIGAGRIESACLQPPAGEAGLDSMPMGRARPRWLVTKRGNGSARHAPPLATRRRARNAVLTKGIA